MKDNNYFVIGLIVLVIAGIVGFTVSFQSVMKLQAHEATVQSEFNLEALKLVSETKESLGGFVHNVQEIFSAGLKAGLTNQFVIDDSGDLTTTGNAEFSGTTVFDAITGASQFNYPITMGSTTTVLATGTLVVGGPATFNGTLTIASTTVINNTAGSFTIGVPIVASSTLTVASTTTHTGNVIMNADLTIGAGGTITFRSNVTATGTLTVTGTLTGNGAAVFNGDFTIGSGGTVSIGSATTVTSTFDVEGETQLALLTYGGGELSIASSSSLFASTTATYTLNSTSTCNYSIVSTEAVVLSTSTYRVFLPSATRLFAHCLESIGKTHAFTLRNEQSTTTLTVVLGTNIVLLKNASSTPNMLIPGGGSARITMQRVNAVATSSGVEATVEIRVNAD